MSPSMAADGEQTTPNSVDGGRHLDSALTDERAATASLQAVIAELRQQVASLRAQVAEQERVTDHRASQLESRLGRQSKRIEKLGTDREKLMLDLRRLEQELALVKGERDALRRELKRVEAVQTETVNFEDSSEVAVHRTLTAADGLQSIDELLSSLPAEQEALSIDGFGGSVESAIDAADGSWEEMLAPELLVQGASGDDVPRAFSRVSRWRLIRSDTEVPQEFRLNGQLMTIGRSELADIRVEGDFVSRIHARLLLLDTDLIVEDAESKNGTVVNGDRIRRASLGHGDVIWIGSVNFRVIDGDRIS